MSFEMTQPHDHVLSLCQLMAQSSLQGAQQQICATAISLFEGASAHLFTLDATAQFLELSAGQISGDTHWVPSQSRRAIGDRTMERCALRHVALTQHPMIVERRKTAWDFSIFSTILNAHRFVSHLAIVPLKRTDGSLVAILMVAYDEQALPRRRLRQRDLILAAMGSMLDGQMRLEQLRVRSQAYSKSLDHALSHQGAFTHSAMTLIEKRFAGQSKASKTLRRALAQTRFNMQPVFLAGHRSAGVHSVARLIHDLSSLRNGPFMSVDAALLTDDVIAPELFGHKRGAIQGVASARKGLLASAAQGTLYIQNTEELRPLAQRLILDLLQSKTFRPIGSTRAGDLRSMLIFAGDPQQMDPSFMRLITSICAPHKFQVPSLLDHREDIVGVLSAYLSQHNQRQNSSISLDAALLPKLMQMHDLPDRWDLEKLLKAALERDLSLTSLTYEALWADTNDTVASPSNPKNFNLGDAVQNFESALIRECLSAHDNNRSLAAQSLGLPKRTLADKCKKYRL